MKILFSSIVDIRKSPHYSRLHRFIEFMKKNHSVSVVSIRDEWKGKKDDRADLYNEFSSEVLSGVNYKYITEKKRSAVLQEIFAGSHLKKMDISDNDIHFNYNSLVLGNKITKYLNKNDVRSIFDVADDLTEMIKTSPQIPLGLKQIGAIYGKRVMDENIRISNKVTYTTESLKQSLKLDPSKAFFLPNGVDTEKFKPKPVDRSVLGITDNDMVFGYLGVLREWVDFDPFLDAFSKVQKDHPRIKALIVGGGPDLESLKNTVMQRSIRNVIFTGTVPYPEAPDYINQMDVCLIPFKANMVSENSLPLKLFEYMSCGKPVISSHIKGVKENVGDRVKYAGSSIEYLEIIRSILDHRSEEDDMKSSNRKFVINNFEWEAICMKLEGLMKEMTG